MATKKSLRRPRKVFTYLKEKGYYDLTIRRMIKFIADKSAAHLEASESAWIRAANSSKDYAESAVSVFATHMIYAATKQIKEFENYLRPNPSLEVL